MIIQQRLNQVFGKLIFSEIRNQVIFFENKMFVDIPFPDMPGKILQHFDACVFLNSFLNHEASHQGIVVLPRKWLQTFIPLHMKSTSMYQSAKQMPQSSIVDNLP